MHPHCCNGCPEQQKPYCRCVYERRRARHAQELSEIELRLGELRRKQTDQVMLRRAIVSMATASTSHSWKQMQQVSTRIQPATLRIMATSNPACNHVLPCQVPTEPPTEPDPRGRLERHVPPSRVRPPPPGSAAPQLARRGGAERENSSAPSAGATKSHHDHSSTGAGFFGGAAMHYDVGDLVLVHQQLVDSQQMHDAQQVSELVRGYSHDWPSMPT